MVEYIAIELGAVALMLILLEVSFNLKRPGLVENAVMDLMDFIKLFFFFAALAMGFFVVAIMNIIAGENGASTEFRNIVGLGIWIWGVFFIISVFAFLIYMLWWLPKKMREAVKRSKKKEEGLD